MTVLRTPVATPPVSRRLYCLGIWMMVAAIVLYIGGSAYAVFRLVFMDMLTTPNLLAVSVLLFLLGLALTGIAWVVEEIERHRKGKTHEQGTGRARRADLR